MKKSVGFIMTIIGAVLSALALILYLNANNTNQTTLYFAIAGLVCCVCYLVLYGKLGRNPYVSFLVSAGAVLMAAALGYSLVTEVEILGYLISGLRTWKDVQMWAFFAVAAALSWIILMIASFTKLGETVGAVEIEAK